jgi:hypothetical protein
MQDRIARALEQIESDIAFCAEYLAFKENVEGTGVPPPGNAVPGTPEATPPEVKAPDPVGGEALSEWCRRVKALYESTEAPQGRAALARQMATRAKLLALPALEDLFEEETAAEAREGVHEALVIVGTGRVARLLAGYAVRSRQTHWRNALDVIYRCLERPEAEEKERPFQRAIRAFHRLKDRALTLEIITRLDEMGREGVAALGEVIYVEDFGYHDHTIALLAEKRDGRAVPPLVYKMNRFKFEYRVQLPAHEALLRLGWYAVPELIDRLDNKAAGIWISWTLRKITGETMGTDKRKWHDWWKRERVRHPELFEDPDERPTTPSSGR